MSGCRCRLRKNNSLYWGVLVDNIQSTSGQTTAVLLYSYSKVLPCLIGLYPLRLSFEFLQIIYVDRVYNEYSGTEIGSFRRVIFLTASTFTRPYFVSL